MRELLDSAEQKAGEKRTRKKEQDATHAALMQRLRLYCSRHHYSITLEVVHFSASEATDVTAVGLVAVESRKPEGKDVLH